MNLLGALAKVGSLTMVSRILGFVRDTIIARAFGAGMATDAFFCGLQAAQSVAAGVCRGCVCAGFCADFGGIQANEIGRSHARFCAACGRAAVVYFGDCDRHRHFGRAVGDLCVGAGLCQRCG
jgi:hypothetical protein